MVQLLVNVLHPAQSNYNKARFNNSINWPLKIMSGIELV